MHIDHENLTFHTEGDVESKLLVPLITGELYLGVLSKNFFSKEYLPPQHLDKGAKVVSGYYPDFSIWMHGFPVCIVEAKAPNVSAEQAYREACLYARHLNSGYKSEFNPCIFIITSNGDDVLFGKWDSAPIFAAKAVSLMPGTAQLDAIIAMFGESALRIHAINCLSRVRIERASKPYDRAGGTAIINAKKPLNSFAADLSPILSRYFSSTNLGDIKEVSERAYVSSAEVTEYDRVLEALLKDRATTKKDTIVTTLEPDKYSERHVAKAILDFDQSRPPEGQLQIVQGAVGVGKSLFIRRYKETLQSDSLKSRCRWAWIDFNPGPPDLTNAQSWLYTFFVDSFEMENSDIDLNSMNVIKGIFSRQIQKRKAIYDDVAKWSPEKAANLRNEDLMKWQDSPLDRAQGLANYILGGRKEILVVVMDNVDRLDLKSQLEAFQLALGFMYNTKCFVIIQMRDETYERFKNKPPLDTFRSAIAFHISPPRFIDVVKKRLDLSLEYLSKHSNDNHTFTLPSGSRIKLPRSALGSFLQELYLELFEERKNVSRILESLAGRDVRRALQMFNSIITSGHLGEDQLTSQAIGAGSIKITEANIIKVLMRTEYRLFSDLPGYIFNIFHFENVWTRPQNFIIPELLFYLAFHRKEVGQIGIEGYFSLRYLGEQLQKVGIDPDDTLQAANYTLNRGLISADHMNNHAVGVDDCGKISASGYIHLRLLSDRIEYIYGIISTTPISDAQTCSVLAEFVEREIKLGVLSIASQVQAVENFYRYLFDQASENAISSGFRFNINDKLSGTSYVLRQIRRSIMKFRSSKKYATSEEFDILE